MNLDLGVECTVLQVVVLCTSICLDNGFSEVVVVDLSFYVDILLLVFSVC